MQTRTASVVHFAGKAYPVKIVEHPRFLGRRLLDGSAAARASGRRLEIYPFVLDRCRGAATDAVVEVI